LESSDDHERAHDGLIEVLQADMGAQFVDAPSRFDVGPPTESCEGCDDDWPSDGRVTAGEMAQGSEKARSVCDELHGQIHHGRGEYLRRLIRESVQPSQGGVLIRGVLFGSAKSRVSIDGANLGDRLGHRRISSDRQRSAGLEAISPPRSLLLDVSLAFGGCRGRLGPAFLDEGGKVRDLTGWLAVRASDAVIFVEFGCDPVEIS
jgi:hypothetical protein